MNEATLKKLEEIKKKNHTAKKEIERLIYRYSFILTIANSNNLKETSDKCMKILNNYYNLLKILNEDNDERREVIERATMKDIYKYFKNNESRDKAFEDCYGETIILDKKLANAMQQNC